MNPGLILILILVLGNTGGRHNLPPPHIRLPRIPKGPAYIDTFKMELMLDRLRAMTNAIDKINHLTQIQKVPEPKSKSSTIDRVQESLEAVKGFLSDEKSSRQVDTLSNTLSSVKKLGDLDDLMATLGPLLSMMKDSDHK
ncbi:MAG: hypothetical protein ACOX4J_07395 [Anaerovoracaceae bacterium]|jgi:hypothetical protein